MSTTMYFFNNSQEDFTWAWDKVPYTVPSGEKMLFPEYLAKHMAKHFVDREMGKKDIATDHFTRQQYLDKCLFQGAPVVENPVAVEVAVLNEKRKPGRPKKEEIKEIAQFE